MNSKFKCDKWYFQKIYWKEKFINGDIYRYRIYFGKQEKYIAIQLYDKIKQRYGNFLYHKKFHKFTNLRYLKKWCDLLKYEKGEFK